MRRFLLPLAFGLLFAPSLTAQGARWTAAGPEGGRVDALTVDAQGVWYAAGPFPGAFRSTDGGATWAPLAVAPPPLGQLAASGRRLWGVGDGVFTSEDGAATWQEASPPSFRFHGRQVVGLAVSPAAPRRAYLAHDSSHEPGAGRAEVDVTTDGGRSWRQVLSGTAVSALAAAPSHGLVAYLGVDTVTDPSGWLLRTEDGGHTWAPVEPPAALVTEGFAERIEALAVAATNPREVVVLTARAVAHSRDGGGTWGVSRLPELTAFGGRLALDPTNPERWLVWGNLARSSYGGDRLRSANAFEKSAGWWVRTEDAGASWGAVQRVDKINQVVWDPSRPGRVLAAVSRLALLASSDGGATWSPSHRGLRASVVCSLSTDPRRGGVVYAGLGVCTGDGGVEGGDDGGYLRYHNGQWSRRNHGLRDPERLLSALGIVADATDTQALYALGGYRLARSRDGGQRWQTLFDEAETGVILTEVVSDAATPGRLYAAGWEPVGRVGSASPRLFQSEDEGETWHRLAIPPLHEAQGALRRLQVVWQQGVGNELRRVVFDPTAPGRLLGFGFGPFRLSLSRDEGATWSYAGRGLPRDLVVAQVVFDPQRPGLVYLVDHAGGLFVSDNGGTRWRPFPRTGLHGAAVLTVAVDPERPGTLYAGTTGGGGFFVWSSAER